MYPSHLEKFAQVHVRSQQALVDFLRVDLELARTFLQTAEGEPPEHPHRATALTIVGDAIQSMRNLVTRVEDEGMRAKINVGVDELEAALRDFGR